MKKLLSFFLVLALMFAPVSPALAGLEVDNERVYKMTFANGLASTITNGVAAISAAAAAITSGTITGATFDNGVIGGVTPAAITGTTITGTDIISTHYLQMYNFALAGTRVASGAAAGSTISIADANAIFDCGTTGGGSSFVVCVSDGTNWISLSQSQG